MEKWEYKVLHSLSEDELNKWGEKGYEIISIIPPPLPVDAQYARTHLDLLTTVVLKRPKPVS
jgi:hypothetical protein